MKHWICRSESSFVYRFVYRLSTPSSTQKAQCSCGFSSLVDNVDKNIEENKSVQERALLLQRKFFSPCLQVFVYIAKNGLPLLDNPCEMDYTTNRKGAVCKMVSTYSGSKRLTTRFAGLGVVNLFCYHRVVSGVLCP